MKLNEAELVVYAENCGDSECENENVIEGLFKESINKFTFINQVQLPDGSQLSIYKRLQI